MMLDYYDAVLGLIPLSLVGLSAILVGVGFRVSLGVTVGAACSLVVLGHAMFVRAPVASEPVEWSSAPGQSVPDSDATSDDRMRTAD